MGTSAAANTILESNPANDVSRAPFYLKINPAPERPEIQISS